MMYKYSYKTPYNFSNMLMISDGENLKDLFFENSRTISNFSKDITEKFLPIFEKTSKWLDIYFSGKIPDFEPNYKIDGLTPFRKQVLYEVSKIPYGKTITYNDIAKHIAKIKGIKKMSAQAVGSAVGFNPICLIIPCHRVIGSNGKMIGYGGEINNKINLLKLEKAFNF